MPISEGARLPDATLLQIGAEGPESIELASLLKGRKVIIFGLPGAFTRTCSSAHMPSIVASADALRARGADEVICLAVNDPFVMDAWGEATGAKAAGITMLADPAGELAQALGITFSAPPVGLLNRLQRFAMIAEDGVVSALMLEEERGSCAISGGAAVLERL
ncbi:peroxiredoxin [Alkalilacustris brevis]|uniref:peroxiredoxin n=1 Tax=Alkalilacustris brevis TaxID=2026338 RepID=UPI000E0D98C1|nr:peroxiredoxin [Alkalilacustris brevis]